MSKTRVATVKGTRDLLPPETTVWAAVEATARRVFARYGFGEIRTPIIEETELFVRGVGEATDIVGKEMYTFEDRKGRPICLRPESTAAVARAYLQHNLAAWPSPVRLYYLGPHFRYERPQAGRYRQFSQIGAEVIGDEGPGCDAELLVMLMAFLGELGFGDLVVRLNTVGDRASRARYGEALRAALSPHRAQLGEDSQRRLDSNPLRILDSKLPHEQELLRHLPPLADSLNAESREHFAGLCATLERLGVRYRVEERLVRGLDYYTRTVFEITAAGLGAHDAILGGGRYDGLIAELGGPAVPGIGFAIGEDRLVETLSQTFRRACAEAPPVVVVNAGAVSLLDGLALAEELRAAGLTAVLEPGGRNLKGAMKRADRRGARFVVLLGEEELQRAVVAVRDLAASEQSVVARGELAADLARRSTAGSEARRTP